MSPRQSLLVTLANRTFDGLDLQQLASRLDLAVVRLICHRVLVLHDGAVVAVLLHVRPTPFARTGIDLRDWLGRAGRRTTLDGLAKAVDARPR